MMRPRLSRHFGLRVRFFVVILGLALTPLLLLPVVLGQRSHAALERQAVALQEEVAAGVASRIDAIILGRAAELAQMDSVAGLRTASASDQRALLSNLLSSERMYQELALVGADGRELMCVSRDEVVLPSALGNRADDAAFRRSVETASTAYGPVSFDTEAREPLMTIAHPLVDPRTGDVELVLVASMRFKPIWSVLAGLDFSDGRDVFVVNTNGQIVAHRNPAVVLRGTVYEKPAVDGPAPGLDLSEAIVATAPLASGDQGLVVVAEQPRSTALRPATEALLTTAIVAVAAALMAGAAIVVITRSFIKPIESMAAAAERVAAGRLHEEVSVERTDEIGELARSFNHMTGELRALVGSLEQRVQDRTFELEAAAIVQQSLIDELGSNNQKMARVQEKLEKLLKSKDEFLGSVSHELRTPLASVVGFASELRDRYEDFDHGQRRELIGLIADQGEDMAHIINDLLVAARADSNSLVVELAPVDLADTINTVLDQVRDVTVTTHLPRGGVEALADAGRIRQILRNLLVNARRYGGPRVSVEVTEAAGTVTIRVCDDGRGIPESEWETIFDPYSRSHDRKGQPASVGLGLTVSRILARRMGGDLTYRYQNQTSMFELVLATPTDTTGDTRIGAGRLPVNDPI